MEEIQKVSDAAEGEWEERDACLRATTGDDFSFSLFTTMTIQCCIIQFLSILFQIYQDPSILIYNYTKHMNLENPKIFTRLIFSVFFLLSKTEFTH